MTERTMPVSKARVHLGEILERVREKGERVILEKNGIPVAAIINLGELEDWFEVHDPAIQKRLEASYKDLLARKIFPAAAVLAEGRRLSRLKSRKRT